MLPGDEEQFGFAHVRRPSAILMSCASVASPAPPDAGFFLGVLAVDALLGWSEARRGSATKLEDGLVGGLGEGSGTEPEGTCWHVSFLSVPQRLVVLLMKWIIKDLKHTFDHRPEAGEKEKLRSR